MNVLLSSAGRRISLLKAFLACVRDHGGRVWAGDADPLAPTFQIADESVVLPAIDTDEYIPTLLDLVEDQDIDLIVPLIDPDLLPLADARSAFLRAGCQPLVSSSSFLDVTLDTWKTVRHFSQKGFRTPQSWISTSTADEEWPDSVFVKPRRGSASRNAQRVSKEALPSLLNEIEAPLVQEVIEAPEVTVDALFDLDGRLLHYVPRLRVRTRAGESIQGRTLPEKGLQSWLRPLLREIGTLGARGPITVQAFLTDPEPTLSEINARFGGGFPLTHAAGGDYPDWIVKLYQGCSLEPRLGEYKADLYMTRAYTEWFFEASVVPDSTD